jgi:hypothetical protein
LSFIFFIWKGQKKIIFNETKPTNNENNTPGIKLKYEPKVFLGSVPAINLLICQSEKAPIINKIKAKTIGIMKKYHI